MRWGIRYQSCRTCEKVWLWKGGLWGRWMDGWVLQREREGGKEGNDFLIMHAWFVEVGRVDENEKK